MNDYYFRPPSVKPEEDLQNSSGFLPFPEYSNLNSRIRKLVSAFQRENKKEEARQAAKVMAKVRFLTFFYLWNHSYLSCKCIKMERGFVIKIRIKVRLFLFLKATFFFEFLYTEKKLALDK